MIYPFGRIVKNLTPPAALVNNGAVTVSKLDCLGAAYATFLVVLGATDIALTVAKLTESDDDNSDYVDITASIFGTANNDTGVASTLPTATDDNHVFGWFVDMAGRKRYIKPAITVGNGSTGAYITVVGELWRNQDGPRLATNAGYTQRLVL